MIYFYKRNKTYLTLFASLILATLSTRLINQIDLSMMNQISSKSSSALILINKITFIDFIFAFTFVPVFGVILSKQNKDNYSNSMGILFKYGLLVVVITTILCAVIYPIQLNYSDLQTDIKTITFKLEIINVCYVPFKVTQYLLATFMAVSSLGKAVSLISILSVPADYFLNILFMNSLNESGCIISTLFLSILTVLIYILILNKKYRFLRYTKGTLSLKESKKSLKAEFIRILLEKSADFVLFGIIMIRQNAKVISYIGIIIELINLLLTPSTVSMRSISVYKKDNKEKVNYIVINLIISFMITLICTLFLKSYIKTCYDIQISESKIWSVFFILIPFILISDGINSVFRGKLQAELKFERIFFIETAIQWLLYLPLSALWILNGKYHLFPLSFLILSLSELIVYTLSENTHKTHRNSLL